MQFQLHHIIFMVHTIVVQTAMHVHIIRHHQLCVWRHVHTYVCMLYVDIVLFQYIVLLAKLGLHIRSTVWAYTYTMSYISTYMYIN